MISYFSHHLWAHIPRIWRGIFENPKRFLSRIDPIKKNLSYFSQLSWFGIYAMIFEVYFPEFPQARFPVGYCCIATLLRNCDKESRMCPYKHG
jgi:hypothetical protein